MTAAAIIERRLAVWLNGRRIATLAEAGDVWALDYDDDWRQAPDAFDLAPSLPRSAGSIVDGASQRPVQWFFDNLLPEEAARQLLAADARIPGDDAFALLTYYGAESAGALALLPEGQSLPAGGLQPLSDRDLQARIQRLPRQSLAAGAPKRMSLAGAQHKLAVVVTDEGRFEPVGSTPSTHILKPDHRDTEHFPHTVANEWFCMTLAGRARLPVPTTARERIPDPIYLIARFDRIGERDRVRRLHAIDACQLLDLDRRHKYRAADLSALTRCIAATRRPAMTRLALYRWLVFNLLIGNHDAHLKNLSFLVDATGIHLAPHYDLLCTVLYDSAAHDPQRWRDADLPVRLDGCRRFAELERRHLIDAARTLGLPAATAERELDRLIEATLQHADMLYAQLAQASQTGTGDALAPGELRLLRQIRHLPLAETAHRLRRQ